MNRVLRNRTISESTSENSLENGNFKKRNKKVKSALNGKENALSSKTKTRGNINNDKKLEETGNLKKPVRNILSDKTINVNVPQFPLKKNILVQCIKSKRDDKLDRNKTFVSETNSLFSAHSKNNDLGTINKLPQHKLIEKDIEECKAKSSVKDCLKTAVEVSNVTSSLKKKKSVDKSGLPVYRKVRFSNKMMPTKEKDHLYDFEVDENEPTGGKKFKKSQKVRKRARIAMRNVVIRQKPIVSSNILLELHQNRQQLELRSDKNNKLNMVCDEEPQKQNSESKANSPNKFSAVDVRSVNIEGSCTKFSPVEDDIVSNDGISDNYDIHDVSQNENVHETPIKLNNRMDDSLDIPIIYNSPVTSNKSLGSQSKYSINSTFHSVNNTYQTGDRYCSTPVRDNSLNCSELISNTSTTLNVSNYFGFDEPEEAEEFLVSPIKIRELDNAPKGILKEKCIQPSVKDVIRLLRFDEGEKNDTKDNIFASSLINHNKDLNCTTSRLNLNNSSLSEIDSSVFFDKDITAVPQNVLASEDCFKKSTARRSYERPVYMRHHNKSFTENSDDEKIPERIPKKAPKGKKKNVPSKKDKKDQEELEKWAKAFNSQCAEIDAFDLCVE